MATQTITFGVGNPPRVTVPTTGLTSPTQTLPATVLGAELDLNDAVGDWANPANAGFSFTFGIEYSPDGGTTWKTLVAADTIIGGTFKGNLPRVAVSSDGLTEAYGQLCRLFATTGKQIRIGATLIITTS